MQSLFSEINHPALLLLSELFLLGAIIFGIASFLEFVRLRSYFSHEVYAGYVPSSHVSKMRLYRHLFFFLIFLALAFVFSYCGGFEVNSAAEEENYTTPQEEEEAENAVQNGNGEAFAAPDQLENDRPNVVEPVRPPEETLE